MPAPEATIAGPRPAAQPSTPNTIMPVAPPVSSQRARAVSTRSMRPGWPSSSVSQATSAPLENAQPSPQSTWVTRSQPNVVTAPVSIMPAARNACPMTSGHLRLNASDHTPAGMSDSSKVSAMTAPRRTSWAAERCAATTK